MCVCLCMAGPLKHDEIQFDFAPLEMHRIVHHKIELASI